MSADDRMTEVVLALEDWQGAPWRVQFRRTPTGTVVSILLPSGCEVARSTVTRAPRSWLRGLLAED